MGAPGLDTGVPGDRSSSLGWFEAWESTNPSPQEFFGLFYAAGPFPRFNPKYSAVNHPKLNSEIKAIIPCEITQ